MEMSKRLKDKLTAICSEKEECTGCELKNKWNCAGTERPDKYYELYREAYKEVDEKK